MNIVSMEVIMPTETFHHLSEEKQQTILNAAKREFASVPFHEASINKIIKEAGISRGSFYMYFKDKEDLYLTIARCEGDQLFLIVREILRDNHGDLFLTYEALYERFYPMFFEDAEFSLPKNLLLNMNFKSENLLVVENKICHKDYMDEILTVLDTSTLDIEDEKELFHLIDMMNLLLIHSLVLSSKKREMKEQIRNRYLRQLYFIKKGVEKGR